MGTFCKNDNSIMVPGKVLHNDESQLKPGKRVDTTKSSGNLRACLKCPVCGYSTVTGRITNHLPNISNKPKSY